MIPRSGIPKAVFTKARLQPAVMSVVKTDFTAIPQIPAFAVFAWDNGALLGWDNGQVVGCRLTA